MVYNTGVRRCAVISHVQQTTIGCPLSDSSSPSMGEGATCVACAGWEGKIDVILIVDQDYVCQTCYIQARLILRVVGGVNANWLLSWRNLSDLSEGQLCRLTLHLEIRHLKDWCKPAQTIDQLGWRVLKRQTKTIVTDCQLRSLILELRTDRQWKMNSSPVTRRSHALSALTKAPLTFLAGFPKIIVTIHLFSQTHSYDCLCCTNPSSSVTPNIFCACGALPNFPRWKPLALKCKTHFWNSGIWVHLSQPCHCEPKIQFQFLVLACTWFLELKDQTLSQKHQPTVIFVPIHVPLRKLTQFLHFTVCLGTE